MEESTVAALTRGLRAMFGWTQPEMARRMKINEQTLRHIESGRREPSKYLVRLSEATHISIDGLARIADLFELANGASTTSARTSKRGGRA